MPAALPGFVGRRPTLGTALAEAVRNQIRQAILAVLLRQPGVSADSAKSVDQAIERMAELLREVVAEPVDTRNAAIDRAVEPLSLALEPVLPDGAADVMTRVRALLRDLAAKLAGNTVLFEEAVALTEFIDPTPFAITGNTLVFRMRKPAPEIAGRQLVTGTPLKEVAAFVDSLGSFVSEEIKKRNAVSRDIFLPTSGVFAEALLGRANASEKLDASRFFNWQDSPIPHLAPAIAQLAAGSRAQEQLDGAAPTVPNSVLNIVNPAAFPDPTGLTGILEAIQNGDIFRDQSKAAELATILGNLSALAAKTTEIAGTLAGEAQAKALTSANEIATTVAKLAQTPTQQGLQQNQPQPSDPVPPSPVPPSPVPPSPVPDPPEPRPDQAARRKVEVTLRVFVEAEVWESRPSIISIVTGITNPVEQFLFLTRFGARADPSAGPTE